MDVDLLAGRLHTPYMIREAQPLSSTSQKRWSWAGVHLALGWPVPPPRAPLLPSGHRSTFLCVDSGASQIRIKNPGHQTRSPPQAGEGQGPRPWPWPFSALPNLPPALAQRGAPAGLVSCFAPPLLPWAGTPPAPFPLRAVSESPLAVSQASVLPLLWTHEKQKMPHVTHVPWGNRPWSPWVDGR